MKFSNLWMLIVMAGIVACGGKVEPSDELPPAKVYEFGVPESFTVTAIDSGAVLNFAYNPAAEGGYKIYFGDTEDLIGYEGSIPSPISNTANSFSLTGLTNGTTYYFAASAIDSDGTESVKTATISVTPVEAPPGQVQKTVDAEISICFNKFNEIKFLNGKMIFTDHTSGIDFPGQDGGCDIDGIQLRTTDESGETVYERLIPIDAPWMPTAIGQELDLEIPGYIADSQMVVQNLIPVQEKCSIFSATNLVLVQAAADTAGILNKIQFDASNCAESNQYNATGSDAIKFQLTYMVEE